MNDPVVTSSSVSASAPVGTRWAIGLGAALLVAMATVTIARRLEPPAATLEAVVQVPAPAAVATPTPTVLAPDPGDNP